jgi:hypothetical protein
MLPVVRCTSLAPLHSRLLPVGSSPTAYPQTLWVMHWLCHPRGWTGLPKIPPSVVTCFESMVHRLLTLHALMTVQGEFSLLVVHSWACHVVIEFSSGSLLCIYRPSWPFFMKNMIHLQRCILGGKKDISLFPCIPVWIEIIGIQIINLWFSAQKSFHTPIQTPPYIFQLTN